jgi:archaellum component FlaC
MTVISCPTCGKLDKSNRQFLEKLANEDKINSAVSLLKIVWDNFPSLRLSADSKTIIQGLSKAVLKDLRQEANEIITQVKTFIDAVRPSIQGLPESVRKDLEEKFEALQKSAPTFSNLKEAITTVTDTVDQKVSKATEKIEEVAKKELEKLQEELTQSIKDTLKETGFPEPEQMKLLSELIPKVLPLLQQLVRIEKVPSEKGEKGELELFEEYYDLYPEDIHERYGGPGDTDIISKPSYNGKLLDLIMTESKMNSGSGWKNEYIDEVQKHMKNRSIQYAILAVEAMPKGANGYMVRCCSEGVIFVTSRENCKLAYGALRAALIGIEPLQRRPINLQKVLADKRIDEPIRRAYGYAEFMKKAKQKTRKLRVLAGGIDNDISDIDALLKQCFKEFQQRVEEALQEINAET